MKRKLDLTAPSSPATVNFNTRRGAVRKWVNALPMANLAELGKRVHEALRQVNSQPTSTRRLFYFLEAVGPAAASILIHLQRQYSHQPLPLSDSGARASRLAVDLLTELLRGYRSVLKAIVPDKEEASAWRIRWYRRELVTTLHRFIRYGESIIEIYRVLHMDPPEGVWKRIHRCYRLAEVHRLGNKRVARFDEAKRKTAVAHEYKRLLLSTLLPAGAIAPQQQKEIEATLDQWAALLQLRHTMAEAGQGHHLVRLARDLGPLAESEVEPEALKSDNTRIIDTAGLCSAIEKRRARGGKGRWWRREANLTPATLTLLHEHWCIAHHRGEARLSVNVPAEVAIGLGALVFLAGGAARQENKPAPRPSGITLAPAPDQSGNWLGKRKEADVWESVYVDPAKVNRAETAPPQRLNLNADPAYSAVMGRLVDKSEHGLAVVIPRQDMRQVAVGMPMAVRTDDSDWLVGTIMRLKDRGEEVEMGMRLLLDGALPARLRTREGQRVSPPFDVVVGRTHDNYRGVATPAISALRSGDPELELDGKTFPVQRGAMLAQSRYMDVFIIELSGAEALAAIQSAVKTAASAPRRSADGTRAKKADPTLKRLSREERIEELMTQTGLARTDAEFIVAAESDADAEDRAANG